MMTGRGVYTFSYGDKYEGGFKNGLRFGEGTYTYANGHIKKGFWMGDLRIVN